MNRGSRKKEQWVQSPWWEWSNRGKKQDNIWESTPYWWRYVCPWVGERGWGLGTSGDRERERQWECVCACVCMSVSRSSHSLRDFINSSFLISEFITVNEENNFCHFYLIFCFLIRLFLLLKNLIFGAYLT